MESFVSYYLLENQCNQSDTCGWEVKLMLFNAMVTQVLLYGVEVWGGLMRITFYTIQNPFEIMHNLYPNSQKLFGQIFQSHFEIPSNIEPSKYTKL